MASRLFRVMHDIPVYKATANQAANQAKIYNTGSNQIVFNVILPTGSSDFISNFDKSFDKIDEQVRMTKTTEKN